MSWTVIAAFAAPAVAASIGAWGLAREQSILRRLERVTAVLKETPESAQAREHLEWLRDDLARRLNIGYRAPRAREALWWGWALTVLGGAALAAIYILVIVAAASSVSASGHSATAGEGVLFFVISVIASFAVLIAGFVLIIRRNAKRELWAKNAGWDDTHSPTI